MPKVIAQNPRSKKKEKKDEGGFGSWIKRQGSDLKDVAAGAVPALYQTATAIDQALPSGPSLTEKLAFERGGRHLDPTALKEQGRAQLDAVKALANPTDWRDHTALQLLTAAGIAAPAAGGLGAISRVARVSKVAKKPPVRTIKVKAKDQAQADKWADKAGLPSSNFKDKVFAVEVPAAKPVTARLAQKGADKVRAKVKPLQRRKVDAHIRMNKDILDRFDDRPQRGIKQTVGALKKRDFNKGHGLGDIFREGNAGLRGSVLFRPGYIPPNLLGAVATNAIHMGSDLPRQFVRSRKLSKEIGQENLDTARSLSGGGIAQGALEQGDNLPGPVATTMSGIGESLSKVTDRRARDRAFFKEAERQGYKTADEIKTLLDKDAVMDSPQLKHDLLQIIKRAEPAAIKFSRVKGGNSIDAKLAQNIFLYKWLTGSARYTGHVGAQHPTLTAALANMPQGASLSEALGVATPSFMSGYIPYGEGNGKKLPKILNPQSLSLWDTLPDFAETVAGISKNPLQAIKHLAPMQKIMSQTATGFNPTVNKNITSFDNSTGKAGYSPYADVTDLSLKDRLQWALEEQISMSPYSKLHPRFRSALTPMTTKEAVLRLGVGGILPSNVDTSIAAFIAAAEGKEAEGGNHKRGRRRKSSSRY